MPGLALLQRLVGDVQRHALGVNDALHHVQPLRHQLIAVVHDEDTSHVQLDVVALLLHPPFAAQPRALPAIATGRRWGDLSTGALGPLMA